MTSYGQGAAETPEARISIEIQTVNKKSLDISCHLPRQLRRFDPLIRSRLSSVISSGQVNLHLAASFPQDAPVRMAAHLPFARQLKAEYEKIADSLQLDRSEISLALLSQHEELFAVEENQPLLESIEPLILEALEKALRASLQMKEKEGAALQQDFLQRLSLIRKSTDKIALLAKDEPLRYAEKLQELYEKLKFASVEEERVLREIAIYAEKVDISEEITRLYSHLEQFSSLLKSADSIGKTLDFLSQEIHREINTIGSKSQNIEITKETLIMKTEVARIREQVMNVE